MEIAEETEKEGVVSVEPKTGGSEWPSPMSQRRRENSLVERRDRLHFCRIFGLVVALLVRSETAAGIFPHNCSLSRRPISSEIDCGLMRLESLLRPDEL
jgi:hypothetical protein